MNTTTLAEVLCNLKGSDPNDAATWRDALTDARTLLDGAARGEIEPWWEN